ncbi:MAG: hypothetical protein EAZ85_01930 [Bacteroidetes bacterium]|nr:MAG: hypothetical protein EAZ85_01930 [Bacteroidota bacterium]TAG93080.1 MAG: hypothetical protein EAZ20_01970 [Bacteroidota bacterium]
MKKITKILTILILIFCFHLETNAQRKRKKDEKNNKDNKESALEVLGENANSTRDAEMYLIEGMKFSAIDDHRKALESFRKALLVAGNDNATINFKLAETCYKLNQMPEAEGYAKDALQKETNNKFMYLMLANIYSAQRRYDDAINTFKNLLAIKNPPIEYNYELAELYLKTENPQKALECYDKLEKHFGMLENIIQQKQRVYLQLNQTDKAIAEGEKLINANPNDQRYVVSLADMLLSYQKTEQALPLLEKIAQEPNPDPRTFLLLAKIYQDKNNEEKSMQYLKGAFQSPDLDANEKVKILNAVLEKSPEKASKPEVTELVQALQKAHPYHVRTLILQADVHLLKKNKKEAVDFYVRAARMETGNIEIWKRVLALEQELQMPDSLAKHAEMALENFPNYAPFWLHHGNGLAGKKNYQKALTSFQEGKMLAINNRNLKIDFLIRLGDTYNALQRYADADKSFDEALKIDEDNAFALNNYSYYLAIRKQKLDDAMKMASKLAEKYPDNATFLDTYGWVLYAKGEYKKSKAIFEKVLQKNAQNGAYIERYGDVLYQLGEHSLALEQWQKARKIGGTTILIDKKIIDKKLYE